MSQFQKFNLIKSSLIEKCIEDYLSFNSYVTNTMNKANPAFALNLLHPMLEDIIGKKLIFTSGNYYKHTLPYLPHTDFKKYENNILNVVIPLYSKDENSNLIIFDQLWELDSVTWCMHYPVQYFESNIGVKGYPSEYPITNKTNKEVDNYLYSKYLNHYKKEHLFSLSGTCYPYTPGSIIVFNTKNIHCTSIMKHEKMGITLRFKEEL